MTAVVPVVSDGQQAALPELVERAARALAGAKTSAEVLDAREAARFAYDAARSAARLARAKGAHDDIIQRVYRAQADALEIEAAAKRRLADEYDAAQPEERKKPGRPKNVSGGNVFTAEAVGLTRKDIHESRRLRDAEAAEPGLIRRTLDERVEAGEEPTRAALKRAAVGAPRKGPEQPGRKYRGDYMTPEEADESLKLLARNCRLATFDPPAGLRGCLKEAVRRASAEDVSAIVATANYFAELKEAADE